MKTKIMLTLVKSEYFDTGHEIEDLSMLSGCRIVSVEGGDQEAVVLTVDDAAKQGERRKTGRPKRAVQHAHIVTVGHVPNHRHVQQIIVVDRKSARNIAQVRKTLPASSPASRRNN